MDEAVGEPIWSLPPDTLKLPQALPSPGWGGRCQAEFTQVVCTPFGFGSAPRPRRPCAPPVVPVPTQTSSRRVGRGNPPSTTGGIVRTRRTKQKLRPTDGAYLGSNKTRPYMPAHNNASAISYISIYGWLDSSGRGTDCGPCLRIYANLCQSLHWGRSPLISPFRPRNGV